MELSVEGPKSLPSSDDNVVWAVARAIMKEERVDSGVSMSLRKGVPVGVGLGSSAASSAAATVAMDSLFDLRLSTQNLIQYAGVGEKAASGTAHYDNVAAAITGGFVMVSSEHEVTRMDAPPSLALCLVTPEVDLPRQKTKYARSLLPRSLPIVEVVGAVGAASAMVHGFADENVDEIGMAMRGGFVDDRRAVMIPGFREVRNAAMEGGAAGVCISGAGPTVLAATRRKNAKRVLRAMVDAFDGEGVRSRGFVTTVGEGCKVVDQQ
jgi:homoserine kinase